MNDDLRATATSVGNRVGSDVSAPVGSVIAIITLVLPLIATLLQGCGGTASAKEVALDHYDEDSDKFDSSAIRQLRPQLRRAQRTHNRQTGENVRLTNGELDTLAVATLREALSTDESTLVSCMAAAGQMSGADE